jgi:hypothetical protein
VDQSGEVGAAVGERTRQARRVHDQSLERALVEGQLGEQAAGGREERVEVLEALVGLLGDPVVGDLEAGDDLLEVLDGAVVEGVEELVEVDDRDRVRLVDHAAVLDLRRVAVGGRERQLNLAARDLRERGRAHGRDRALLQRRVFAVDRERDERLVVVADRDLVHRAHGGAADDDLVAGNELTSVLELGSDLVGAAPSEHQHRHDDDRHGERDDRCDPPYGRRHFGSVLSSSAPGPGSATSRTYHRNLEGVKAQPCLEITLSRTEGRTG